MRWIILLLLATPVHAIVISHVMYDPDNESTGEFVRLYNNDTVPRTITGWYLSTERSEKDAIIPEAVLLPGQYYTIGDVNVSADHNEPITLNNQDSGVKLVENGTVIDVVGWGSPKQGWYQGSPATPVSEGTALVRTSFSGNNAEDFAQVSDNLSVQVEIIIEPLVLMTDDSPLPGFQVRPVPGKSRIVHVFTSAPVVFQNTTYLPTKGVALIPLPYWLSPGNYTMLTSKALTFTYLPLKKVKLVDKLLQLKGVPGSVAKGVLLFENIGNVAINLSMTSTFSTLTLYAEQTYIPVRKEQNIIITARIPETSQITTHKGTLRFSY